MLLLLGRGLVARRAVARSSRLVGQIPGYVSRALSTQMEPREQMEYDVVIVGGGPAGLSAAIRLKQLELEKGREVSVCVVEKGSELGAHILSGNVFEPRALDELLPDWREDETCPLKTKVTRDSFRFLTASSSVPLPTPPVLHNEGNYIASLSQVVRWLGERAEALGVEIYPGFAAAEVLYDDDGVRGVATRDSGLDKTGQPKESFERGVELVARQTLFAEGAKGSCSESVIDHYELRKDKAEQSYGLGIKEVWEIPVAQCEPGRVEHTLGWPLSSDVYGGSFLYHTAPNLVYIGLVVGLDYANPHLSPYKEFQRLKHHPHIAAQLEGGECVAYGARVINEGGWQAVPKLTFPGGALIGCSAGFVNVPKIKGTHTAMKSAMLAADAVFDLLETDQKEAVAYQTALDSSWVADELKAVRNYKPAFEEYGLYVGMVYSGLTAYILRGNEPWTLGAGKKTRDAETTAKADDPRAVLIEYPKPDNVLSFPLLESLSRTSVTHEDQPSHLRVKPDIAGVTTGRSLREYAGPERNFCPAGVYEYSDDDSLVVNAQNCIHCKCCAIKMPYEYINWTVPEGGGGPNYQIT